MDFGAQSMTSMVYYEQVTVLVVLLMNLRQFNDVTLRNSCQYFRNHTSFIIRNDSHNSLGTNVAQFPEWWRRSQLNKCLVTRSRTSGKVAMPTPFPDSVLIVSWIQQNLYKIILWSRLHRSNTPIYGRTSTRNNKAPKCVSAWRMFSYALYMAVPIGAFTIGIQAAAITKLMCSYY